LQETDLPDLKDDEVLVKLLYLSNDPAQRGCRCRRFLPCNFLC
jgi:NADPH-dependent curcumin reductase CurA